MIPKKKNITYTTEINVSQYLDEKGITWVHERPVCILDEENHQRIWYPDFYLPTLGLYLEVCGTPKDRNEKTRRKHVYAENQIQVIFIDYYKDDSSWQNFLIEEIKSIERDRNYQASRL